MQKISRLYISGINGTQGYCAPADALKNVDFTKAILANDMGFVGHANGIIDNDTLIEMAQISTPSGTDRRSSPP